MAKAKKQEKPIEQRLEETLVLYEKTPYKLPSSWCWTKLPYITQIKTGKRDANHAKEDGQYRFYTCSAEYSMADTYAFEGESIIVPGNGDIGLVFYYDGKFEAYQRTYVINGFKGQTKYLYYYFYYKWREKNTYKQFGTAIPYVRMANFEEFEIPLAPLEEQKRIVEIIDKQFAKLDEARDLIQESLDTFVDRKSAILHRAFTGELTKQWRENNIIDNVYQIASSLGISEIQQTSCGWLKVKSENACSAKISCGHTPTKDILSFGEIPFLKVYNIVDNMIDFEYKPQFINSDTNNKLKSSELKPGDVIMNIVGPPLRKIALIPETYNVWNMNQAIVRFRAKEYILPKFIYYMLIWPNTLDDVVSKTKGVVGQANISVTQSRNLDFVIPSRQEQEEIVRILDSIFEKEDKSKELLDMLDKIDEMKKSILARAFRGQLGTFNPTDEPATDLLRKILEQSN